MLNAPGTPRRQVLDELSAAARRLGDLPGSADRVPCLGCLRRAETEPVKAEAGLVGAGDDAAQHGDAQRPAKLPCGVVDGGAHPGLCVGHRRHDVAGRRGCGDAHAGTQQCVGEPERKIGPLGCGHGEHGKPGGDEAKACGDHPPAAEAVAQRRTTRCNPHLHHRNRHCCQPGVQRRVAAYELEVQGIEKKETDHGEEGHGDHGAAHCETQVAKQLERQHRVGGAALTCDEAEQRQGSRPETDEHAWVGPTQVGALDNGKHQRGDADERQHGSRRVEWRVVGIS